VIIVVATAISVISTAIIVIFATAIIVISTAIFLLSKPFYALTPVQRKQAEIREDPEDGNEGEEQVEKKGIAKKVVLFLKSEFMELAPILRVFLLLPAFWALFYQQNSTWVYQANEMDLRIHASGLSFSIPPDLMPSFEDVSVLILIPTFDRIIYPLMKKLKLPPRPLKKMVIGFFFVMLSFILAGLLELWIQHQGKHKVHVLMQVPQIVAMGIAETTVAITVLEFAYSESPVKSRGTVTALWGITSALGTALIALIALIPFNDSAVQFFVFAGMMGVMLCLFVIFVVRSYHYIQPRWQGDDNDPKDTKTVQES